MRRLKGFRCAGWTMACSAPEAKACRKWVSYMVRRKQWVLDTVGLKQTQSCTCEHDRPDKGGRNAGGFVALVTTTVAVVSSGNRLEFLVSGKAISLALVRKLSTR